MPAALLEEVRDAGPLAIDDEAIAFEDDGRSDHEATACLADPWVTATTHYACDFNS
ncbi:SflA family class IV lanthipeptide [Kitasatospora sp. CM 4170]|uniref:SflA family class IV lanthipeptide n=1 Tax=Kitasatospora aburaviensis TaxID=67265 RepID=A0ABW1EZ61_9ACTN|nr:SflA family class IV lanthipeptide [Kitasatospora sp. CM 4170]WNM49673.1 SflA family class IV lanthipeptide [Kitasatospora sp. CM 4170]